MYQVLISQFRLENMTPIHGVGMPREGVAERTGNFEESWLGEALSVKHMEMFPLSSCPIWHMMVRVLTGEAGAGG